MEPPLITLIKSRLAIFAMPTNMGSLAPFGGSDWIARPSGPGNAVGWLVGGGGSPALYVHAVPTYLRGGGTADRAGSLRSVLCSYVDPVLAGWVHRIHVAAATIRRISRAREGRDNPSSSVRNNQASVCTLM